MKNKSSLTANLFSGMIRITVFSTIALVVILSSQNGEAKVSGHLRSTKEFLNYHDFMQLAPKSRAAYVEKLRWFMVRMETRMAPNLTGKADFLDFLLPSAEAADGGAGKFCIVTGFIAKRDDKGICRYDLAEYPEGFKNLSCAGTNERPCNPLLFGFDNGPTKPYCAAKGPQMTRDCSTKTKQSPAQVAAVIASHPLQYKSFMDAQKNLCPQTQGTECPTMAAVIAQLTPAVLNKASVNLGMQAASLPAALTHAGPLTSSAPDANIHTTAQSATDGDCIGESGAWQTVCTAKSAELSCAKKGVDLKKFELDKDSVFDGIGGVRSDHVSPVTDSRNVQQDWDTDMGITTVPTTNAHGHETSVPDIAALAQNLIEACKKTSKKYVVRIEGDDQSNTYVCSEVTVPGLGKRRSRDPDDRVDAMEEEEGQNNLAMSGKYVSQFPFLRLYPADGAKRGAIVEASASLDAANGSSEDPSESVLRLEGADEAFARRTAITTLETTKQAEKETKAKKHAECDKKSAKSSGIWPFRKKSEEAKECESDYAVPQRRNISYDVFLADQCKDEQAVRPYNILRSMTDAQTQKKVYINCDGSTPSGPFKKQTGDSVTGSSDKRNPVIIMDEDEIKLTVDASSKTCQYKAEREDKPIVVEAFTPTTTPVAAPTPAAKTGK